VSVATGCPVAGQARKESAREWTQRFDEGPIREHAVAEFCGSSTQDLAATQTYLLGELSEEACLADAGLSGDDDCAG